MELGTAIGIAGVVVNLTAYGLLSAGYLNAGQVRYQLINIAGTTALLISLMVEWNLSSFILNVAWFVIALVGIARIYWKRRAV